MRNIYNIAQEAGTKHLEIIKRQAGEVFAAQKQEFESYIRASLQEFADRQTYSMLLLLSLGHPASTVVDFLNQAEIKKLGRAIYVHLDEEMRKALVIVWHKSLAELIAKSIQAGGRVDRHQVRILTEKCVQKEGWLQLQPFARSVVQSLFRDQFLAHAKEFMPKWIGLASHREVVRSTKQVLHLLPSTFEEITYSSDFMFGATPISEAINLASLRLLDPAYRRKKKLLVLFSDGEFENHNPLAETTLLKKAGVIIVCCCISGQNVLTKIRSRLDPSWPPGAKTLWELASTTSDLNWVSKFAQIHGVDIPDKGRLLLQLNHSDTIQDVVELLAEYS